MRLLGAAAIIASCLAVQPAAAAEVHLLCAGDTAITKTDTVNVSGYPRRGSYSNATETMTHREVQTDEIKIEIDRGHGRIWFPADLVPGIHTRSDDGWRDFKEIAVSDDTISGHFELNFLNKPRISISRLTGRIDITGLKFHFAGTCQPYDPETVVKKF